jgi:putative ABC transport system permease protein
VTVLFDAGAARAAGWHEPGGATPQLRPRDNRISPAAIVLVLAVFGLIFIGLVAVAGFTVMAQRRLRSLGMLGALGAADRHVRLVLVASGTVAGAAGTLIGAVAGLLAWLAYTPRLQASAGHVIDPFHLPWPVIAIAMALAVVAATAAAWRPARSAARIPVVAALSGRPAPPKSSHRFAAAGLILLAAGPCCLAFTPSTTLHGGAGQQLLRVAGIVATSVGALLLAPLAITLPVAAARRAPVAVRLAVRDLGRYRARSGAALAAVSFAVFLATGTCILATAKSSSPLTYTGRPNLAANQLIIYEPHGPGSGYTGLGPPPTQAELRALAASVNALATSFHAQFVLALYSAGRADPAPDTLTFDANQRATLWQATSTGTMTRTEAGRKDNVNYQGSLYVATPALMRDYGIKPSQVGPGTDILTSRAGLDAAPRLDLLGQGDIVSRYTPWGHLISERYNCHPASCITQPKIQTLAGLPAGTDAPNTVITPRAVRALGQQLVPDGWLIQASSPVTAAQENAARQLAVTAESLVETASGAPSLSQIQGWATATAIILALCVLAMATGLIRVETASDLRTLTATGASSTTRRTLTAASAGALGLLGALLGTATAYLTIAAWAHGSLSTTLSPVPAADLIAILAGLPLAAAIGGWLLAGRQPPAIARQPLE